LLAIFDLNFDNHVCGDAHFIGEFT